MNNGLTSETTRQIHAILAAHPDVEKAILYGSRAKGNHKPGSDIDLTLLGENLTPRILGELRVAFDESTLPYRIDLSILSSITHVDFLEHIRCVGVVFYEKRSS